MGLVVRVADGRADGCDRAGFRGDGRPRDAGGRDGARLLRWSDRGAATVWLVAVMAVVCVIGVAVCEVAAARVARHRAQSAADLAALAGAQRALGVTREACDHARLVAHANGAVLESCSLTGAVVEVTTSVPVPLVAALAGGPWKATAMARAGPVEQSGPVE
jgi:secretion/DNA translocation related TadE-like protein